jgi:hypothetical protein
MAQNTDATDAPLIASDLEPGDKLRDVEGHGETNPYGPDLTDEIAVKRRWGYADKEWSDDEGDSWLMAPVVENGRLSSNSFAVTFSEIDARLDAGRYQPVDVEVNRTLNTDALPVDPDQDLYVRFGDIPDDERSYNSTDECYEDGVSVYDAEVESVPPESDAGGMFVPVGPKTLQILMLAQRDTYLVTGDRVGMGVDGEPVLRNVEIVAELEWGDEASGWIISRE